MTEANSQIADPRFPLSLRMRPEFPGDAETLREALREAHQPELASGVTDAQGDVVVSVPTADALAAFLVILDEAPDLHRMMQTMDLSDDFTGKWIDDHPDRAKRILGALGDGHPEARRVYLHTFQPEAVKGPEGN